MLGFAEGSLRIISGDPPPLYGGGGHAGLSGVGFGSGISENRRPISQLYN
jgi:hypothetical protein